MNFLGARGDRSGCHASAHAGTPYPCSQKDIDRACQMSRQRKEGGFVEINPAIDDLIHYNRLDRRDPPPVSAAVSRLRDAVQRSQGRKWGRDIIIKAGSLRYTNLGSGGLDLSYVVTHRGIVLLLQTSDGSGSN